ncbi:Hemin import ATP-binding protein HmuV [compost metagenome]
MDEPTNHLDIRYQLQILDLVKTLQITALAALHDLNLAACYCDRLYVLKEGKVVASGITENVLQPDLLRSVFGVETEIRIHPKTGKPSITFLPDSLRGGDRL